MDCREHISRTPLHNARPPRPWILVSPAAGAPRDGSPDVCVPRCVPLPLLDAKGGWVKPGRFVGLPLRCPCSSDCKLAFASRGVAVGRSLPRSVTCRCVRSVTKRSAMPPSARRLRRELKVEGQGLYTPRAFIHSSTSQLNLSRVWSLKPLQASTSQLNLRRFCQ